MLKIDDDLAIANHVKISNVWMFSDKQGRRFIIDTGDRVERIALRFDLGRENSQTDNGVDGILLTHRHRDHAGNAAWLRERFRCPVACHELDKPFLEGFQKMHAEVSKTIPFYVKIAWWIENNMPTISPVDKTYTDGDSLLGFQVFSAPGHSDGSVLLYHQDSQTLFSGDAILAGPLSYGIREILHLKNDNHPIKIAMKHHRYKELLKILPPVTRLCSGHGPVIRGNINNMLRKLIK